MTVTLRLGVLDGAKKLVVVVVVVAVPGGDDAGMGVVTPRCTWASGVWCRPPTSPMYISAAATSSALGTLGRDGLMRRKTTRSGVADETENERPPPSQRRRGDEATAAASTGAEPARFLVRFRAFVNTGASRSSKYLFGVRICRLQGRTCCVEEPHDDGKHDVIPNLGYYNLGSQRPMCCPLEPPACLPALNQLRCRIKKRKCIRFIVTMFVDETLKRRADT